MGKKTGNKKIAPHNTHHYQPIKEQIQIETNWWEWSWYQHTFSDALDLPPTQDSSGKWKFRLRFPILKMSCNNPGGDEKSHPGARG